MSNTDDFFETQKLASLIKTRIVVKYFEPWARIMANQVREGAKRIGYIDLFCGPGRYGDGSPSTPVQIIEHAIKTPDLCEMLVSVFNDVSEKHTAALEKNLNDLPGIENLKHEPMIRTGEVDAALVEQFKTLKLIPTFSFLDPFGYKGLTLDLVDALMRGFGCDMVMFFSYDSINRALTNPLVKEHIDALLGTKKADELRAIVATCKPEDREELLIEKFIEALGDLNYEFVLPYAVDRTDKDRTSHYLIFISKHARGYSIMKDVMYALSEDKTQGVANFGLVKSITREQTPLLALLNTPLDDFAEQLCDVFAGESFETRKLLRQRYDNLFPRNPFVDKNWRDALTKLEQEGKIEARPPAAERRVRKGVITFGENTKVTFLPKERS